MQKNLGTVFILAAGILWGFMGVFVNLMESMGFTAIGCTTIRILAAALIFVVYTAVTAPEKLKIRFKDVPLLAATGAIGVAGMSALYIACIDLTSLSMAAVLLYTSPVWVMLMSLLFLKDSLSLKKVLAALLAFGGCWLVAGAGETKLGAGILLGVGAGIAYASYSIFGTFALRKHETLTVTTYAFVFGFILMLFIGDVPGVIDTFSQAPVLWKPILGMLATGLFTAVLPFLLYTKGLQTVPAGKSAVLACAEPVMASVLGRILYNENLNYMGIALILLAIFLLQNRVKK